MARMTRGRDPDEAGSEIESRAAAETTGARILRGSLWAGASSVIPLAYVLVVSIAAARYLGPDGMGRQSYIAFLELSLTALLASGIATSLMRHIGEALGQDRPDAARGLVAFAWRLQLGAALVGAAVLAAAGLGGADPRAAWVLAGVGCAFGVLHAVPSAVLIGAQRWRAASIVGIVTGAVATGASVAVLALGGGIVGLFAVQAAVAGVNLLWSSLLARSAARELTSVSVSAASQPLRRSLLGYAGWQTLDVLVTILVAQRSEIVLLERLSTDAEIALFSISFAGVAGLAMLADAVGRALTPAFATWHGAGAGARMREGYRRGLRLVVCGSLPLTALSAALAPELLRLVYGEDYAGTAPVVRVLSAVLPLLATLSVASAVVIGVGRIRIPLLLGVGAAAVDIALSVALIPELDAVGAAVAFVGAQLAVAAPLAIYAARLIGPVSWSWAPVARFAAAAAGAGAAAWATLVGLGGGAGGLLAGIAAGVAALLLVGRAVLVLEAEDAAWLAGRIERRGRPRLARALLRWAAGKHAAV
jgi:O-antigen/teichoic acid export membrane protein